MKHVGGLSGAFIPVSEDEGMIAAAEKGVLCLDKLEAMVVYPLLFICALDVLSIFTGWIFKINSEGHYQETELFWVQGFINYAYLLIPTAVTISRAVHAKTKQDREEFLIYVLYMIAPLVAGIYEDEFAHVPLLALNILMIILILFLRIQNLRISTDALTGLNNRCRLNTFLSEKLVKTSPESKFLIFIIDINNFKAINDQYGHIEGDHGQGIEKRINGRRRHQAAVRHRLVFRAFEWAVHADPGVCDRSLVCGSIKER